MRSISREVDDRPIMWLACVFALFAGCYIAFYQLGAAIDEQHDRSARLAATARNNEATDVIRINLERAGHALDAQTRALDLQADHATIVARFIRECSALTSAHRTMLTQIDERAVAVEDSHRAPSSASDARFETIPLDVTLHGSYRDLLATIRALTQAPVLMQIDIADIERVTATGDGGQTASLSARLRVNLKRLSDPALPSSQALPAKEETVHAQSF